MGSFGTENCEGVYDLIKHLPPQLALKLSLVKLDHSKMTRLEFGNRSLTLLTKL